MKHLLKGSLRVFRGQAYVEYALILAVGAIGMVFAVNAGIDAIGDQSETVVCDMIDDAANECDNNMDGGGGNAGLPVARFIYSCSGSVFSFDATSSFDTNGEIVQLEWEFSDGGDTADGWTPNYEYSASGEQVVTLTVYDNDGNMDDTSKVVDANCGEERPECPPSVDVDGMPAGTILTDQFQGISITTHNPDRHPAMLFDSANPTGGDTDIGSPHQDFGGPGHGEGGAAGMPGENSIPQGMVMIISEDGDTNDPDDNAGGGEMIFEFEYDAVVNTMSFLDIDDAPKNPTVKLYDRDGSQIWSQAVPALGDNSFVLMDVNQEGVAKLVVDFPGSGSVDGVFFCEDDYTASDAPVVNQDDEVSENQPPMAAFDYTCNNMTCRFDATGSDDADGNISHIFWEFGDDKVGNAEIVSHSYEAAGRYTVKLTVTDNDGETQSVTQVVELNDVEDSMGAFQCEGDVTVSLSLIDADTNASVATINEGDVFDLSDMGVRKINIEAVANGNGDKSMQFEIDGSVVTNENAKPYAIGGDNRGNFRNWQNYSSGEMTMRANAYSSRNGGGDLLGCIEVTFTIQD